MAEVTEGIYLETKKTNVGTGHTASQVVFRSFYAVRPAGEKAEIFLLDDDLGLTGLREQITAAELAKRMQYVPRLQGRYQAMAASLGPRPAAARPKPAVQPPAKEASGAPAQTQQAAPPAENKAPNKAPAKPAPPLGGQGDAPWWEQSSQAADRLFKKK